jgi:hypothetical protein
MPDRDRKARPAQPSSRRPAVDRADDGEYGDYGTDDARSIAGAPRAFPRTNEPPNWIRRENIREKSAAYPRIAHDIERGIPEAFGFSAGDYPHTGVASEGRRGRFFGRGPKGYRRSDERIREEISDRLMTHPDIDASDMEVCVSNGVVTLSGIAEDRHEKRLAEYIAEDALGVEDVENRLKIRHGFWAAITGEAATERELPRRAE